MNNSKRNISNLITNITSNLSIVQLQVIVFIGFTISGFITYMTNDSMAEQLFEHLISLGITLCMQYLAFFFASLFILNKEWNLSRWIIGLIALLLYIYSICGTAGYFTNQTNRLINNMNNSSKTVEQAQITTDKINNIAASNKQEYDRLIAERDAFIKPHKDDVNTYQQQINDWINKGAITWRAELDKSKAKKSDSLYEINKITEKYAPLINQAYEIWQKSLNTTIANTSIDYDKIETDKPTSGVLGFLYLISNKTTKGLEKVILIFYFGLSVGYETAITLAYVEYVKRKQLIKTTQNNKNKSNKEHDSRKQDNINHASNKINENIITQATKLNNGFDENTHDKLNMEATQARKKENNESHASTQKVNLEKNKTTKSITQKQTTQKTTTGNTQIKKKK